MEFKATYPARPESARTARHALVTFSKSCDIADEVLRDIEIAIGEAISNAIEHGNQGSGFFDIVARCDGESMTVDIKDQGNGFAAPDAREPVSRAPFRGWGVLLMRNLVDSLSFLDEGSRVRLVKRLTHAAKNLAEAEPKVKTL